MSSWPPMLFRPESIFRTSYARVRMHTRMTIVNFLCDLNEKTFGLSISMLYCVQRNEAGWQVGSRNFTKLAEE